MGVLFFLIIVGVGVYFFIRHQASQKGGNGSPNYHSSTPSLSSGSSFYQNNQGRQSPNGTQSQRPQSPPPSSTLPAQQAQNKHEPENEQPPAAERWHTVPAESQWEGGSASPDVAFSRNVKLKADPDLRREDFAGGKDVIQIGRYYAGRGWEETWEESDGLWRFANDIAELAEYGRMKFLNDVANKNRLPDQVRKTITRLLYEAASTKAYASDVAKLTKKPFDMTIRFPVLQDGAMKESEIAFNGWRLDHFERVYLFNDGNPRGAYTTLFCWDYCLGQDGKLYMITSRFGNHLDGSQVDTFKYRIEELIPLDGLLKKYNIDNLFVSVTHGMLNTLDAMPVNRSKHTIDDGNEHYTYNFPLQADRLDQYAYQHGDGVCARLDALLPTDGEPRYKSKWVEEACLLIFKNFESLSGATLEADVEQAFMMSFLMSRVDAVKLFAEQFPSAQSVYEQIKKNADDMLSGAITQVAQTLMDELDLLTVAAMDGDAPNPDIASSGVYRAIMAAYAAFPNDSKETSRMFLSQLIPTCGEELWGNGVLRNLLAFALWFSGYSSFRSEVLTRYQAIREPLIDFLQYANT